LDEPDFDKNIVDDEFKNSKEEFTRFVIAKEPHISEKDVFRQPQTNNIRIYLLVKIG
jgi:hypothetical protein